MKAVKWVLWIGIFSIILMLGACKFGNVSMTILQTSDSHHHASGYGPFNDYTPLDTTDNDSVLGGYARLATLIGGIRAQQAAKDIPTLLFDSGDFFMGTVYDLTASDPIALKFIEVMEYDAVTLGNHEFDWSPAGLAMLLSNAANNGFDVPVLATNTITDGIAGTGDDGIEYLTGQGVIVNKKIIDLPCGGKIGVLGLMGEDADDKAPVAPPITFNHDYAFIQECVNDLRNNDGVQLVVVLSHGGVNKDGTGDDANLANNVKGIDIIASGHFHTATTDAQVTGDSDTIIFSPGSYGEYLSRLDVTYNIFLRKIVKHEFTLIPVDDTVPGDAMVNGMVEQYHTAMNASLAPLGVELGSPISTTSFALNKASLQVTGIGSLCADSLRAVANSIATLNDEDPYQVGVVASGVIRDAIYPGSTGVITFSDVYNMLPLGISPYDSSIPGYPLMSVYATGADIYTICEVALTFAPMIGSDYYLNFSGLKINYNPAYAPYFQGVTEVSVYDPDDSLCMGTPTLIDRSDPATLYRIVVDLYALQILKMLNDYLALYGIPASINPVNPSLINAEAGQEFKEWMAPLNFLPGLGGSIPSAVYGPGGIVLDRVNIME